MNKRYLGALIMCPFVIFIFLGGQFLKYAILALSLAGLYEFFKVVKAKNMHPVSAVAYVMTVVYYILLQAKPNHEMIIFLLIVSFLVMLCIPVITEKYNFVDVAITMFGFLYVAVFFGFITLVNLKPYGNYYVWLIFIASWLCDTAAYYAGRFLGKHKLNPRVSAKKTIEGSIGGLLGSTIACTIFAYIAGSYGASIKAFDGFIIGLLCGVLCQFGDLAASSIKRYCETKDYSNLIPGHGGILDRFDSILFASVVVYYYITFFMGK